MLYGDINLAAGYANRTQQARRISEDWIAKNGYCLRCESDRIVPTPANTRTRDFVCDVCTHGYELKSKRGVFTNKVLDGAYDTMIETIKQGRTPTFLLLEYSPSWSILGLRAIHHSLITEVAILPRKPLSINAKRAGWRGCNIVLPAIALQGQIPIVASGIMCDKNSSRGAFAKLESLATFSTPDRTWAATILNMTDRLGGPAFSLRDMYRFEPELQLLFPRNRNIRPKIRQQLQVLRDAGLLEFLGGGVYGRPDHARN